MRLLPGSGVICRPRPTSLADVIDTPDLQSFAAFGIEQCYQFHGYSLANDVTNVNPCWRDHRAGHGLHVTTVRQLVDPLDWISPGYHRFHDLLRAHLVWYVRNQHGSSWPVDVW